MELENTLEQEQEALVNKLWKRMDKLETEKRMLQIKLDQPVSDPASPRDINNGDTASNLSAHIQTLRSEVARLRSMLAASQQEHTEKMQRYVNEERSIREENLRLQRKLQLEVERREALCRHLSESESSLEMEEERHYNEQVLAGGVAVGTRQHTVSPIPYNPSPSHSRPLSPGGGASLNQTPVSVTSTQRCYACGQVTPPQPSVVVPSVATTLAPFLPVGASSPPAPPPHRRTSERFIKPAIPAPQPASPMDTTAAKE